MSKLSKVMIGSDVEYFVENKETHEVISAEGLIQGTKKEPFHFDETNRYYATSLDNVLAEGNIPPTTNALDFYRSVEKLRAYIDSTLPTGMVTAAMPSARLDYQYLMTENAMIFGCDPSINCWTMEEERPEPKGDNLRCAGFHIHVGYENPNEETNRDLARAMDLFLGVPSVLLEPANERKAVGYGKAGNFRNQKHGMEYRSLSSYFASSRKLIRWAYKNARAAIKFVEDGRMAEIENMGDMIQECINNENKALAEQIVNQFNIKY